MEYNAETVLALYTDAPIATRRRVRAILGTSDSTLTNINLVLAAAVRDLFDDVAFARVLDVIPEVRVNGRFNQTLVAESATNLRTLLGSRPAEAESLATSLFQESTWSFVNDLPIEVQRHAFTRENALRYLDLPDYGRVARRSSSLTAEDVTREMLRDNNEHKALHSRTAADWMFNEQFSSSPKAKFILSSYLASPWIFAERNGPRARDWALDPELLAHGLMTAVDWRYHASQIAEMLRNPAVPELAIDHVYQSWMGTDEVLGPIVLAHPNMNPRAVLRDWLFFIDGNPQVSLAKGTAGLSEAYNSPHLPVLAKEQIEQYFEGRSELDLRSPITRHLYGRAALLRELYNHEVLDAVKEYTEKGLLDDEMVHGIEQADSVVGAWAATTDAHDFVVMHPVSREIILRHMAMLRDDIDVAPGITRWMDLPGLEAIPYNFDAPFEANATVQLPDGVARLARSWYDVDRFIETHPRPKPEWLRAGEGPMPSEMTMAKEFDTVADASHMRPHQVRLPDQFDTSEPAYLVEQSDGASIVRFMVDDNGSLRAKTYEDLAKPEFDARSDEMRNSIADAIDAIGNQIIRSVRRGPELS